MGIVEIVQLGYQCEKCKHAWIPVSKNEIPGQCPSCQSFDWFSKERKRLSDVVPALPLEDLTVETLQNLRDQKQIGRVTEKNTLNDLTGKQWIKFTKSWFIDNPPPRKENEILHPAKFPEKLAKDFISFFTKKGDIVLDPFLGSGSTIVACSEIERSGIGIELSEKYYEISLQRSGMEHQTTLPIPDSKATGVRIIKGDAREADVILPQVLADLKAKSVDFVLTSPPYWKMLKESRGGVESASKQRKKNGLDTHYSEDNRDLENIGDYDVFLETLVTIFATIKRFVKPDGYIVIVIQNVITNDGEVKPLAWDIARRLSNVFEVRQEKIWCQDNKPLGIWGYPKTYVSNVHHHYCLVFQNKKGEGLSGSDQSPK